MDRLQIIVVAKNITVLQLFISRMPKMCAIPQFVSAPLNPIPTVEHFRRSHSQCEHIYGQHIYMIEENSTDNSQKMRKTLSTGCEVNSEKTVSGMLSSQDRKHSFSQLEPTWGVE